jgi:O-antigen/teichoic acid export membrane protein
MFVVGRLKANIASGLVGLGWIAIIQLLFTPLYLRLLGPEAYGLIGFYMTLQAALQVFDLGISSTLNRELARSSALPSAHGRMRDLVRTLEFVYWPIGISTGAAIWLLAPMVASRWLNVHEMSVASAARVVSIMGLLTAVQWPISFYYGGLMGLQKHVYVNVIKILVATLSYGGAALLLAWRPSITLFFYWQMFACSVNVISAYLCLWWQLPGSSDRACFNADLLRGVWRFSLGITGISLTASILTQIDKVVLSRLLPLEIFGYYILASVLTNGLRVVIGPVFVSIYPRLTELVARQQRPELTRTYHVGSQLMAVLTWPAAVIMVLFSYSTVLAWTGSPSAANIAGPLVTVLAIGTALNAIMHLPYALQLANGWTRIGLWFNVAAVAFVVPAIIIATHRYGAIGAAFVWCGFGCLYIAIIPPLTHRRVLPGEGRMWVRDIVRPLIGALLVALPARALYAAYNKSCPALPIIVATAVAAVLVSWAFSSELRTESLSYLGVVWKALQHKSVKEEIVASDAS